MVTSNSPLSSDWMKEMASEFEQPYMIKLQAFLKAERDAGHILYPAEENVFAALNVTPFKDINVVILGQDPYHGAGQAHGLSFSVPAGVRIPPSLRNIYKEIAAEFGSPIPTSGDLTRWAEQGVLLLNATLTVEEARAGAHQKQGWEHFTDAIVSKINQHHENVVFMLWGSHAQKKGAIIDRHKHFVLESVHPSPLSAHRGFLGNGHFKKANDYLLAHRKPAIAW